MKMDVKVATSLPGQETRSNVLQNVNFQMKEGEFVSIMGPSGYLEVKSKEHG